MPNLQWRQLIYVDASPLTPAANERTKSRAYKKLMSRTQVPHNLRNVSSHRIIIHDSAIPNIIFIDRATPVPSSTKHPTFSLENAPTTLNDTTTKVSMPENTEPSLPKNDDYVVDKIFGHESTNGISLRPKTALMSNPLTNQNSSLTDIRNVVELAQISNNNPGRPRKKN